MSKERVSKEFRLKNIDETGNYLIEKINENELMSKKHEKVYVVLNYIEDLLVLISTVSGCVSICNFAPLVGFPIGIPNSAIGLKICVIPAEIKRYKSIIKKKKKKHEKILSLAESKLNSVEDSIFTALINSNIGDDVFVLINDIKKI